MNLIRKYPKAYNAWREAKARCLNKSHRDYPNYGGRGITFYTYWVDSFETFLMDMGAAQAGLSLERIDNNKGYSPANCRWATDFEQANNRRNTSLHTLDGKTQSLVEWARELDLDYGTLKRRAFYGWSTERILLSGTRKGFTGKQKAVIPVDRFELLRSQVIAWGALKGILDAGDPKTQCLKLLSEAGELADGIASNDELEIADAVGDLLVTIILLCELLDIEMLECLRHAYDIINARTGKMVNGTFVKD